MEVGEVGEVVEVVEVVRVVEVREEAQYQLEKYDRVGVPGYSTPVNFQLSTINLVNNLFIVNCQITSIVDLYFYVLPLNVLPTLSNALNPELKKAFFLSCNGLLLPLLLPPLLLPPLEDEALLA